MLVEAALTRERNLAFHDQNANTSALEAREIPDSGRLKSLATAVIIHFVACAVDVAKIRGTMQDSSNSPLREITKFPRVCTKKT